MSIKNKKVSAIVPVYNEEKTISDVLKVLVNSEILDEVVVVDDSSTDDSLKKINKIKNKKLKIISLEKNVGKSDAVKIGVESTKTDILFFCDADLHNLNEKHIEQILEPFYYEDNIMSAGMRDYGFFRNIWQKYFYPLVTGERAIPYAIFEEVKNDELWKNYGMEVVLNNYCKRNQIKIIKKIMSGLRQTNKPIKRKNGFYLFLKEIFDIYKIIFKLKKRNLKEKIEILKK